MAQLALFLTIRTKPGKRDALKTLWEQHLKRRAEENEFQSSYVYAFDLHDGNVVRITEVYETKSAFEENSQAGWFAEYMKVAAP